MSLARPARSTEHPPVVRKRCLEQVDDGGGPDRDTPTTSPRATTRRPGGRAARGRLPVASRAAPGPARGRAAPGRRDATRAPVRFGGANPERTTCQRPSQPETHEHERAGHPARDGTAWQQAEQPVSAFGTKCSRPRRAGRSPGWPERGTPTTSPRATTRRPGGRAARVRPPVASRAAPGPARGRAAPGRRDATRARVRFGGANPERTTCERPSRPETHEQERAGQRYTTTSAVDTRGPRAAHSQDMRALCKPCEGRAGKAWPSRSADRRAAGGSAAVCLG